MAEQLVYVLPRLSAEVALEILADLIEKTGAEGIDRVHIQPERSGQVVLSFRTDHTRFGADVDPRIEGMLYQSYNRHPSIAGKGGRLPDDLVDARLEEWIAGDATRAFAGLIGLAIASSQSRFLMATGSNAIATATALDDTAYVLGVVGPMTSVAEAFARIEWRSSGMTLSCLGVERAEPPRAGDIPGHLAIARIGINPEWGGTEAIVLRHQELFEGNVDFRLAYPLVGGHLLLLKPQVQLAETVRVAASRIVFRLMLMLGAEAPKGLALDWLSGDSGLVSIDALEVDLPKLDILSSVSSVGNDTVAADGAGGEAAVSAPVSPPVDIDFVRLAHLDDATVHLRGLLEQHAGAIGHRLSLQRLPDYSDSSELLMEIDRQIDELAIRRDLILGEGAGDWRLLRFPAEGIEAFVDYLRRFSLEVVDSGHLRYGFSSSSEDPRGVHFLLYRLRDVGTEPAYPTVLWRDRLKCGTISHRVDPMFAQFAVAQKARSLVFTPPSHVVVPNFRATQSDIDSYLKQGFGGFFNASDVADVMKMENPIYCFGQSEDGRLRIEILDGEDFQPVRRVIPFLNDNLQIGHYLDTASFVSEVVDAHWRGQQMQKIEASNAALAARLEADMAVVDRALASRSEGLLDAMAEEVNALRVYLSKITGLMEDLSDRSVALEQLVSESIRNASSYEDMIRKVPGKFSELESTRRTIQDAIWTEHQNSQAFVQTASRNIGAINEMIESLREELDKDA
nr:hypothetical protein [uncultured Cohaesibacter sp.]